MYRRQHLAVLWLVVVVLAGCAAPGATTTPPQAATSRREAAPAVTEAPRAPLEKITLATPQLNGASMPYAIAVARGFFREEGFEVELPVMRGTLIAAGLASGEVDYISAFSPGVRNALSGLPMRVILGTATLSTRRLMTLPAIQSVPQLKGQAFTIASLGDGPHSAAMLALEHYGLDPQNDVTWLVMAGTTTERIVAMQQGIAQAIVVGGSEVHLAEAMGLQTLLPLQEVAPLPESGVSTSLVKLETQREQVKRVLRALVRGLQYTKTDREGSIPLFMERLRLSREEAEQAYDAAAWSFSDDGTVSERSLRLNIEAERRHLKIAEEIPNSRVADFGPLHEVLREMGITPAVDAAR